MRHTFIQYALLVAFLLLAACSSGKGEQDKVGGDTLVTVYNNPVIPISVPDPTVLRAGDGYSISMVRRISATCLSIVLKT